MNHLSDQNNDFCTYTSIFDLIQAKFGGVSVDGGQVVIQGGNSSFVGASTALYIVDGIPVSDIVTVQPCQVATIDILKGPAAAIYGSRGGNGAVVITLRKQ
ncbi:MAG: TonB-dependent receptor plug domain-containing protein [Bacteroidales bacterium]